MYISQYKSDVHKSREYTSDTPFGQNSVASPKMAIVQTCLKLDKQIADCYANLYWRASPAEKQSWKVWRFLFLFWKISNHLPYLYWIVNTWWFYLFRIDQYGTYGVDLIDMNVRTQIRHIPCGSASDINLTNDVLMVCGVHSTSKYFEKGLGHRFWKLSELLDFPSRKLDLTSRMIEMVSVLHQEHQQGTVR